MKRVIRFSKFFMPAAILSVVLVVTGIAGWIINRGFNLGIDFQAGLIQEIQFAPTAFHLTYDAAGNASVSLTRSSLDIVITGSGVEESAYSFPFASYPTQADLVRGLQGIDGIRVAEAAPSTINTEWLVQSAQSTPQLDADRPFTLHYLRPNAEAIRIEDVRASLLPLGTVSVQKLGADSERRFMIRMEDSALETGVGGIASDRFVAALEEDFGKGEIAVTRSDFVGSRFSRNLTDQAGMLVTLTMLLVLAYMAIRFKFQYALGAVIGILYDGIVMVAFIVWTRMEFNTTTIAAILTILGYSTNNTIVVFDRVRENLRLYPDESFVDILDRSLTGTLGRTIITTLTTMVAVVPLFIFTTGAMKDFSLALLVGMTSGVYTTMFIASGFVNFWHTRKTAKGKRKPALAAARAS